MFVLRGKVRRIIMSNLVAKEYELFEDIKYTRADGTEFWYARELASFLDYTQ